MQRTVHCGVKKWEHFTMYSNGSNCGVMKVTYVFILIKTSGSFSITRIESYFTGVGPVRWRREFRNVTGFKTKCKS